MLTIPLAIRAHFVLWTFEKFTEGLSMLVGRSFVLFRRHFRRECVGMRGSVVHARSCALPPQQRPAPTRASHEMSRRARQTAACPTTTTAAAMSSAAAKAEARRKAILNRGADRLAKLTTSARGEDSPVYSCTSQSAVHPSHRA